MKYFKFLFSGTFMGILLAIFAISIGYATFVENDFDATTAKMLIYNAHWFEVLMMLMVVNFTGMIFTRQLYRKSKLNILVIHVSLVIIIIGAAITRYIGFEGQMHIRQDQTTDQYVSMDTYMNVHIEEGTDQINTSKRIWLSPVRNDLFSETIDFKNETFEITLDQYQPDKGAKASIKKDEQVTTLYLQSDEWGQANLDGIVVSLKFGNQKWVLPFSLKLNEFQLERYPGSMSPSSFASEITLIDKENNVEKPYRIFMNNILEYKGYRFYQSSYDGDEKGTVLSVNHDYWGTMVTYFGYFLLFATLIISFFTKKTRFAKVSRQIKETHDQRKKLVASIIVLLLSFSGPFQAFAKDASGIDKEHAAFFGTLLVQNKDGRIIPLNTTANEVLVKIYKKNKYDGQTADQVFLGMIANPDYWQNQPMIKVSDEDVQKLLGINGQFARYLDFFNEKGQYKLKTQINAAYAKKPAERNMFDKELIYVDERINVSYMAYNGSLLKILPIENDLSAHWESPVGMHDHAKNENSEMGIIIFRNYLEKLVSGINSRNYEEANNALQALKEFQIKSGGSLIPSATKTNLEIFYNNTNIFKSLFPIYMMMGIVLFGFFFVQIFKPALEFKLIIKVLVGILVLCFVAQTFGLGLRWYIAEHAPWSNGYESMIYISWATMLAGFVFMKKSPVILSITSLLTGVTLLTAHMSWMNPEITNLVPVLKSYWLTIHVATITGSYGFLALGGLTAFLNLCIMIFRNKENRLHVNLTLKELSLIIELSFTVGLILLVVGNFLGGIWANESWGRYWGWDPKETWSLVTIIVYSFILHMRLIPGLRNTFSFNLLSMFAFSSVLMTYFGVNYYLSGLHSYASGDPIPVPTFVYYTLAIMLLISAGAAYNDFRLKDLSPELEEENS